MIRVLIADDHATVRQGLTMLVASQPDMEVVGEAGDGRAAVQRVIALQPAVVVIDISMPTMNGLDATRELRARAPATAVVALTRHGDQAFVKELLKAGASGYVLKQSASIELLKAIRAAVRGESYLDSNLEQREAAFYLTRRPGGRPPTITERETEVLRLMALGHGNKDIGAALEVSVKTVEVHKANAMRKLGLQGRTDVVKFALLQGWLRDQ